MAKSFREHIMNKKILLGAAISIASMQASAVPFAPTDARAMAMGGTGVSSAEVASTLQYNPALLATTRDDDHFGLTFPAFGVSFSDEDDFIDEVEDFDEESTLAPGSGKTNIDLLGETLDQANAPAGQGGLQDIIDAVDAIDDATSSAELVQAGADLDSAVSNLEGVVIENDDGSDSDLVIYSDAIANDLDDLNSKGIRINGGGGVFAAIPSKKLSIGVGLSAQAVFSGNIFVPAEDTDQLRNYSGATQAYLTEVQAVQTALTDPTTGLIKAQSDFEATPNATTQAALTAAIANVDTAQQSFNEFNYGGTATPGDDSDGSAVIFQDGELAADDTQLNSYVHMVGAAIADVGLTVSRVFNIANKDIAIGITPKLQAVTIFDYIFELDGEECTDNNNDGDVDDAGECTDVEFDEDSFSDNTVDFTEFNIDLGAAHQFGSENQWQAGVVVKNLMGKEFESANGATVKISPMVRAGISHKTDWTKVAFDLDLTENDPIAFEDATQYASLGAEFNAWRILQLRAGYRANLAASGQDVVTAGFGFSPLAVRIDLGVMANASDPEKEAGFAFEFGVEF
jgi:hypothetical protein